MTNTLVLRDPNELQFHPLLESMPATPVDSPEMLALIASVETHGCLRPVLINDRDEIMDGRALVYAAGRAGHKEVPCLVLPDEDAAALALDTLCGRRHLSRSALAYLAFPILEAAGTARHASKIRGLMAGKKARASTQLSTGHTVEQVSAALGFSREYFYRAREVHSIFTQHPEYKTQMEPRLLTSDEQAQVSLRGIIAGWEAGMPNKGKERRQADQLDLFGDVFGKLRYHFQRTWASIEPERRQALVPQVRDTVAEMPPEVRAMFSAEIRAADKAAKEAGQAV